MAAARALKADGLNGPHNGASLPCAIYALTRPGALLALRLAQSFAAERKAEIFLPLRLKESFGEQSLYFQSISQALADNFGQFGGHIVVGAAGLVVRVIAPLLKSKKEDPAVVVISQDGRWVISLLSGHLGGANDLARAAAAAIGGQAVITTATDVEGLPAPEVLARDLGLEIEDFGRLAAVSRRLAENVPVTVYDPFDVLAPALAPWPDNFIIAADRPSADSGPRIVVDDELGPEKEPDCLVLRPRTLALGLGCHRGLAWESMEAFIVEKFIEAGLALKSVDVLATGEMRAEEPALNELSRKWRRPLLVFPKDELARVETPNPSGKVLEHMGVTSVCEASAMLAAEGGRLILPKQKGNGTTLAVAVRRTRKEK